MADSYGKIVKTIPLSHNTNLCVKANAELNGKKYVDLREYVETAKYSGPTRKGLFLPEQVIKELALTLLAIAENRPIPESEEH